MDGQGFLYIYSELKTQFYIQEQVLILATCSETLHYTMRLTKAGRSPLCGCYQMEQI